MSFFLIQKRRLVWKGGDKNPRFPAKVQATVALGPSDAFGVRATDMRTTGQVGERVSVEWDANEGRIRDVVAGMIEPLQVEMGFKDLTLRLEGNILQMAWTASDLTKVNGFLGSATNVLPAILSLRLGVPVWIRSAVIKIGDTVVNYEVAGFQHEISVTTTEIQEKRSKEAFDEWLGGAPNSGRLVAALHYFRHAQRLSATSRDREAFCAEILLNLWKTVEVLVGDERDQIRATCMNWGIPEVDVERQIVPLQLLRSELGVAHSMSAPLNDVERDTVIKFIMRASSRVQQFLEEVYKKYMAGEIELPPDHDDIDSRKRKILERIAEYVSDLRGRRVTPSKREPEA